MKKIISLALVCVTLLSILFAIPQVQAAEATEEAAEQSLDAVMNCTCTVRHWKSGLYINVPNGKYSQNPYIILWPADYSREQVILPKFYSDGSMRMLFDENTKYCIDIFRGSSKTLRTGMKADSWRVTSSEDLCQLFDPYIVPGKDDIVIFRMKGAPHLALGAKKTSKNAVLQLMKFDENDSRLYFQFCDEDYQTIDLAVEESGSIDGLLKPMPTGISATLSSTSIKSSESVTVKISLDATALADTVNVQIGSVSKSVSPSMNKAGRVGQTASLTFKGSEIGASFGHKVTVTVSNKAGSTSIKLADICVAMSFVKPLKAVKGGKINIVTQGFGESGYYSSKDHLGVDYSGAASYVVSICDGVVVDVYTGYGHGYGNTAVVKCVSPENVEFYVLYGHMKDNSLKVKKGDTVTVGQRLGTMGSTGVSSGAHVHVAVFTGNYKPGKTIPAGYYPGKFSGSSKKYNGFVFYDVVQVINTEGAILK